MIIIVIGGVVILLAVVLIVLGHYLSVYKIRVLRNKYQESLKGSDRILARKNGDAYYRLLRRGKITSLDKYIITEDTATMNR